MASGKKRSLSWCRCTRDAQRGFAQNRIRRQGPRRRAPGPRKGAVSGGPAPATGGPQSPTSAHLMYPPLILPQRQLRAAASRPMPRAGSPRGPTIRALAEPARPVLRLPCGPPAGSGDFPTHAAWPGKARRPAIALLDLLAAARRQTHRESRPGWWWCMSAGPNGEGTLEMPPIRFALRSSALFS